MAFGFGSTPFDNGFAAGPLLADVGSPSLPVVNATQIRQASQKSQKPSIAAQTDIGHEAATGIAGDLQRPLIQKIPPPAETVPVPMPQPAEVVPTPMPSVVPEVTTVDMLQAVVEHPEGRKSADALKKSMEDLKAAESYQTQMNLGFGQALASGRAAEFMVTPAAEMLGQSLGKLTQIMGAKAEAMGVVDPDVLEVNTPANIMNWYMATGGLDSQLKSGLITKGQYDEKTAQLNAWAESKTPEQRKFMDKITNGIRPGIASQTLADSTVKKVQDEWKATVAAGGREDKRLQLEREGLKAKLHISEAEIEDSRANRELRERTYLTIQLPTMQLQLDQDARDAAWKKQERTDRYLQNADNAARELHGKELLVMNKEVQNLTGMYNKNTDIVAKIRAATLRVDAMGHAIPPSESATKDITDAQERMRLIKLSIDSLNGKIAERMDPTHPDNTANNPAARRLRERVGGTDALSVQEVAEGYALHGAKDKSPDGRRDLLPTQKSLLHKDPQEGWLERYMPVDPGTYNPTTGTFDPSSETDPRRLLSKEAAYHFYNLLADPDVLTKPKWAADLNDPAKWTAKIKGTPAAPGVPAVPGVMWKNAAGEIAGAETLDHAKRIYMKRLWQKRAMEKALQVQKARKAGGPTSMINPPESKHHTPYVAWEPGNYVGYDTEASVEPAGMG